MAIHIHPSVDTSELEVDTHTEVATKNAKNGTIASRTSREMCAMPIQTAGWRINLEAQVPRI
eukprot:5772588-Amphidinium_carterae.1